MATYSDGEDQLDSKDQFLTHADLFCRKIYKDEMIHVTPVRTPSKSSRIAGIQKLLQEQVSLSCDRRKNDDVSPTLVKLRNTPAGSFPVRRHQLIIEHEDVSRQNHKLTTRGGVCLWPKMNSSMQLSYFDLLWLIAQVVLLCFLTSIILIRFHGKTLTELQTSLSDMKAFCDSHHINVESPVSSVADQVSFWHHTLLRKTEILQNRFDLSNGSTGHFVYLMCYVLGLSGLFYYLVDSLRAAKERLTVPYIRLWICLLSVICTWTVVIGVALFRAYQLELQVVSCVQQYSLSVAEIGSSVVDLTAHQTILLYWKSRFLDTSSRGLLHIVGPFTVKDLVYYLVYYSAPIITVLLGPVVRLFISCWDMYSKRS